jgi:hypothetical protein
MIDVELIRAQASASYHRAEALRREMRAAQHRLLYRSAIADRAQEVASRRRGDGRVPAEEAGGVRSWTAWIAARPEDR